MPELPMPVNQPSAHPSGSQTPRSRSWLWARRIVFAVTDQGLMSGSNFILSILLARWLSADQYGAYALAFSIFFFISAAHQALLLEPMSVLGTSDYVDRRREYAGAMFWTHCMFSLVVAIVLAVSAWLASLFLHPDLAMALLGLAIGAPGILLLWLARTACYIEPAPAVAACGAGMYSAALLGGAWALTQTGRLSTLSVLLLMGAAGAIVGAALLAKIRPSLAWSPALIRDVATRHWSYGRWALGSSLVIWVPGNIFYSIITAFLGIGSAGAYRALMNLSFPVTHTSSALAMLFQPQISRIASSSGKAATIPAILRLTALYGGGAVAWLVLATFETERIWKFLYRGSFRDASGLVFLLLVGVVFQVAAYAPAVGLRALQAPSLVFASYAFAAVVCVAGGIPATRMWGLPGAIGSYSAAMIVAFLSTAFFYRKLARRTAGTSVRNMRAGDSAAVVLEAR
jgi:O-antigen/teichoic acid export membrane protein